jgi:hypothetical protein
MSGMRRVPGWPERLAGYVASHVSTPFVWGSHDCVTFAAGAVQAVTLQRPRMPQWSDVHDALRQLRAAGGLVAAVESAGLADLARPALALRGDVLLIDGPPPLVRRPFLAVCIGHAWAAPGPTGLAYGPRSAATRGWRVG